MTEAVDHAAHEIPPECALLRSVYQRSGITVAELATASGLSPATITIVLTGIRYRDGVGKVSIPSDRTLVKLAAALRIRPDDLREVGRGRAAELLAETAVADDVETVFSSEQEAKALILGQRVMAQKVLAVFSTEELRAEIERREAR